MNENRPPTEAHQISEHFGQRENSIDAIEEGKDMELVRNRMAMTLLAENDSKILKENVSNLEFYDLLKCQLNMRMNKNMLKNALSQKMHSFAQQDDEEGPPQNQE